MTEVAADDVDDARRPADLLRASLLTLLSLDRDAKGLALLLALCLHIHEPLETLLLALRGSRRASSAPGELGIKVGANERSGTERVHFGCTFRGSDR